MRHIHFKMPGTKKSRNKIYSKILISITIWTVIIIFITSTVLYVNFEKIAMDVVQSSINDGLSQVSYSSSFMTQSAKTLATQIYFNTIVSKLFSNYPLSNTEIKDAITQVNSYRAAYPYIYSIYIYNNATHTVYTSFPFIGITDEKSFFDKDIFELIDSKSVHPVFLPIPRKVPDLSAPETKSFIANVYTYIFQDMTDPTNKSDNMVILNISQDWIREIIQSLDKNSAKSTYIIDKNGVLVSSNEKENVFTDLSANRYIKDILASQENYGYVMDTINGEKSLITYVSAETLGWKFLRIIPYSAVLNKLDKMKFTTLLIGILIMLLGLIISFFISYNLYEPFDGLLKEMNILYLEKRNNLYPLKQEFLRSLLINKNTMNPEVLQKKFGELEINLDMQGYFVLVLFRIDHYTAFCNKNNVEDRAFTKRAIINISSALFAKKFRNEAVDMPEDLMVILLSTEDAKIVEQDAYERMIRDIQQNIHKHLDVSISAAISITENSIYPLNSMYSESLILSGYRLFKGHECILHPLTGNKSGINDYIYPFEKEKLLVDTLMLGKTVEVKDIYAQIIAEAANYNLNTFNSTLLRLAVALNSSISLLGKNNSLSIESFSNFLNVLNTLETVEEINEHFYSIFELVSEKLEEKKARKYDALIAQVTDIINRDYMNQNLSRESLADSAGISASYLGQLFKQFTAKTIADYINEKRMEKAKELFTNTDLSLNEIVEKSGYVNVSYFCTLFKKMNGLTPNEFRRVHRKR